MKRLVIALFAALLGVGMMAADAEAKRLGGGKSFGMSRDNVMKREAAPQPPAAPGQNVAPAQAAPKPAAPQPAPQSGMSRWLGPLAGLAAGIGLAALLSHFGLGEGFATLLLILLIAVAVFFVFRLLFRRKQPAGSPLQYAGAGAGGLRPEPRPEPSVSGAASTEPGPAKTGAERNIIAGFDTESFVRQAKLSFVRLQAANDAGNIGDIREFTTPEMFSEIKLQMQERGSQSQQTDVVTLNAEVLDVSEEGRRYVASVRFSGTIRETAGGAPTPFDEVWHLVKPVDGNFGWLIAGIEQTHTVN